MKSTFSNRLCVIRPTIEITLIDYSYPLMRMKKSIQQQHDNLLSSDNLQDTGQITDNIWSLTRYHWPDITTINTGECNNYCILNRTNSVISLVQNFVISLLIGPLSWQSWTLITYHIGEGNWPCLFPIMRNGQGRVTSQKTTDFVAVI